jgi:lipopolysaccharide biosynthesis glycosyltransferase
MFVQSDILELWDICTGDKPLWCVHHDYKPHDPTKMDGVIQTQYGMKNWSSFIMFDCGHKANLQLSPHDVSNKDGNWLHTFKWLQDQYGGQYIFNIGKINEEWNWLDGHSETTMKPKNVHFTTGGPWFTGWTGSRPVDNEYAAQWMARHNALQAESQIG